MPPAAVVTCPVTGTPTGPAPGPLQGVTGSDNDGNPGNNTVDQTAANPVPGLGPWSMALLAGMLGVFGLRRRTRG